MTVQTDLSVLRGASAVLTGVTPVGAGLGLALAVATNLGVDRVQPEDAT